MKYVLVLLMVLVFGCNPAQSDDLVIGDDDHHLKVMTFAQIGQLVENLYPLGYVKDNCQLIVFSHVAEQWSRFYVYGNCDRSQRPTFIFGGYYATRRVTDYAFNFLIYRPITIKFSEYGWVPIDIALR